MTTKDEMAAEKARQVAEHNKIQEGNADLGIDPNEIVPGDTPDDPNPSAAAVDGGAPEGDAPERDEPKIIKRAPSDDERSEIAKRFRQRREAPQPDEVEGKPDMLSLETQYGKHIADQQAEIEAEPEAKPAVDPAPKTHKIKVRGEIRELTNDEFIEYAQRGAAAESYLTEAREALEQAEAIKRAARQREEQPRQHPGEREPRDEDHDDEPGKHPLRDVIDKIQFGEADEAADLLEKTINDRAAAMVRQTQASTTEELAIRTEHDNSRKAYTSYAAEHPDLAADQNAHKMISSMMIDEYRKDLRDMGMREDELPRTDNEVADLHLFMRAEKLKLQNGQQSRLRPELASKVRTFDQSLKAASTQFQEWRGVKPTTPATRQPPPTTRRADGSVSVSVDRSTRRAAIPTTNPTRSTAPRALAPELPETQVSARKAAVMRSAAFSRSSAEGHSPLTTIFWSGRIFHAAGFFWMTPTSPMGFGKVSFLRVSTAPSGPMSILAMLAVRQLALISTMRSSCAASSGSGPNRSISSAARASRSVDCSASDRRRYRLRRTFRSGT